MAMHFSSFKIGNESDSYRIQFTGYSGTAGNAMNYLGTDLNNKQFTTVDRDNDR